MSSLLKKLRITNDLNVQLVNTPDDYYALMQCTENDLQAVSVDNHTADAVHLFVKDFAEFHEHLPTALAAIKDDGLLWISYPKGTSKVKTDINRDSMWKASADYGIRPVSQVSLDATWSAIRFRPFDKVGK